MGRNSVQPKTDVKFDKGSFERLKKTIKNMSASRRELEKNSTFATKIPQEVGIQLTSRCNLRCKHCFEWNEEGFNWFICEKQRNNDIDFTIIEKIFRETHEQKSNIFLWGGEPMIYNQWHKLTDLLEKDPRWTVLCTNGMKIEDEIDSLVKISSNLAILTSIEGFEEENDYIRGKGTYKKVMQGIKLITDLQQKNIFKGKQSINCTVNDHMIGKLYDFVEYCEELGIDTLYLCFPWYIPEQVSVKMDDYYRTHFNWIKDDIIATKYSWHSFKYKLNPDLLDEIKKCMDKINNRVWKIRVRFQPAIEIKEVEDYILGKEAPVQNRKRCLALSSRMDVLSSGKVTACKHFSELCVGDLSNESVAEVWTGEKFMKVRETIGCGLMPVCSKCILLYLNGA